MPRFSITTTVQSSRPERAPAMMINRLHTVAASRDVRPTQSLSSGWIGSTIASRPVSSASAASMSEFVS